MYQNNAKRMLSLFLVVLMLIGIFPTAAFAEEPIVGDSEIIEDLDLGAEVEVEETETEVDAEEVEETEEPVDDAPQASEGEFTVTYYADEATDGEVPFDAALYAAGDFAVVLDGADLAYNDTLIDEGGDEVGVEYAVAYWVTEDGDVYYPDDEIEITGDVALYAEWCNVGTDDEVEMPEAPKPNRVMTTLDTSSGLPGQLTIDKKAEPNLDLSSDDETGEDWVWDITLTLQGINKTTPSYVVLVLDRSGSMAGTKMTNMQAAANAFVTSLLSDENTNVAIVSFAESATTNSKFTDNATQKAGAINGLRASGGTNIQAGIHAAQELIDTAPAGANKYIVLLGDGQPTYSQRITAATGVKYNHTGSDSHTWTVDTNNYGFTFNYGSRVGDGSSFTSAGTNNNDWTALTLTCSNGNHTGSWRPANHGIPTIYEANLAKTAKTTIYSIAFGADANGQNVLKSSASGTNGVGYYYALSSTDTSSLSTVFTDIKGKIAFAADDAIVTDPMGDHFTIVPGSITWTPSSAPAPTISVDPVSGRETITWNVGKIEEKNKAYTLKYSVKIDVKSTANPDGADPYVPHDTNDPTYVMYTDVEGKPNQKKDFPIPKVAFPMVGNIEVIPYYVNASGYPSTLLGSSVSSRELADKLGSYYYEDPNWDPDNTTRPSATVLNLETPYTIEADDIIFFGGKAYKFVVGGTTQGDTSPQNITLTALKREDKVYFGYRSTYSIKYFVNGEEVESLRGAGDLNDSITVAAQYEIAGYDVTPWAVTVPSGITIADGKFTMPAADVELHASSSPKKWDVTYDWGTTYPTTVETKPSGQSGITNGTTFVVDTKYVDGYVVNTYDGIGTANGGLGNINGTWTFGGWDKSGTLTVTSDIVITGDWEYEDIDVAEWDVTYAWTANAPTSPYDQALPTGEAGITNGGSHVVDTTYAVGDIVYSYDGLGNANGKWTFLGWDKSGTLTVTSDIVITGDWEYEDIDVPTHEVSYAWTGDIPAGALLPDTETVTNGDTATEPTTPAETGYVFDGWYTDEDCENKFDFDTPITEDTVLHGKWTANDDTAYTVEFYYEGTDGTYPTVATDSETRYGTTDTLAEVTDDDKIPTGSYIFDVAELDNVLSGNIAGDGSLVLKVYFKAQYTVSYDLNGGDSDEELEYEDLSYGDETPKIEDPTREGYEFDGWEPEVADNVTEDVTYKAHWKPIIYKIIYVLKGGKNNAANPDTYTVESGDIKLKNPTRSGYSFVDWYTDEAMKNKVPTIAIPTGSTGDRIFYAKWSSDGEKLPEIPDEDPPLGSFTTLHYAYIIGYETGLVLPQNLLSRAEAATVFFRLLADEVRDEFWTQTNDFSDVDGALWYNNAVSVLSNMEIINGYLDGTFNPNGSITRGELATIAAKFALRDGNPPIREAEFTDISGHWAEDNILFAASIGWLDGYEDGSFKPDAKITRAEFITLVNRMLERVPESAEDLLDDMKKWPDNMNEDAWYYLAMQEATNSHDHEFKTVQIPGRNFFYEKWLELLEIRDWAALEKAWVMANSNS